MTPFAGTRDGPGTATATAGLDLLLWAAIAIAAACIGWLGEGVTIVAFAAVSWWALRAFPLPQQRSPTDRALAVACMLSVPVQYAFVAAHAYELFVAVLPLATLMVLPLLALVTGNTRHLLDRIAERGFVVMLCVYCVAHAPALLLLDGPTLTTRNGLLIAFLVVAAHAGVGVRIVLVYLQTGRGGVVSPTRVRVSLELPAVAALGALIGLAFAAAMPVPAASAAAIGAGIASLGWLGTIVLARLRADAAPEARVRAWGNDFARPDALCFAAPVFLHLMRAI